MNPHNIITKLSGIAETILVAASAGSDSMVLLDALYRNNVHVVVCYVDHQQRPKENNKEKTLLTNYCEKRDIPFFIETIDIDAYEETDNKQAFFRAQRYKCLRDKAERLNITTIATAHHQDDQAETQLMRLIKNYDVPSYTGIVPVQQLNERIKVIRPLLDVRKTDILAYCEAFDVPYFNDSSNQSDVYFRNRLRKAMPVFEAENQHFVPEFIEKMNDFVAYQQHLQKQLQETMTQELPLANVVGQEQVSSFLQRYHPSLQKLAIPVLLQDFLGYTGKIKQDKVKEIINCLLTNPRKTSIMLDGDTSLGIQYGKIFLSSVNEEEPRHISMRLTLGENIIGSYHVVCSTEEAIASAPWKTLILHQKTFEEGIYLRYPKQEDYLPLKQGKKKLNRLYIDEKVLPHIRFSLPVLVNGGNAVIYDVATGKVGFSDLSGQAGNGQQANIYLHIKKRLER